MLDYGFWWDVAHYGNEAWKGGFSEREIAENAYNYICEWEYSVKNENLTDTMETLINNLTEDALCGSEEAMEFLDEIKYQIRAREIKREAI